MRLSELKDQDLDELFLRECTRNEAMIQEWIDRHPELRLTPEQLDSLSDMLIEVRLEGMNSATDIYLEKISEILGTEQ